MNGDTGVPMPDPEAVPDDGSMFTADQRRRVEALQVARKVLESRGAFIGSKVEGGRDVYDLMNLAEWVLEGSTDDELSPQTLADAGNKMYFDSGWEAVRREVLSLADMVDPKSAVDWIRDRPAGGRLISGTAKEAADAYRVGLVENLPTAAELIDEAEANEEVPGGTHSDAADGV